ncbi:MAG: TetR/AcrR family transcriptional regulator [Alcanivoracaceae bacterium]
MPASPTTPHRPGNRGRGRPPVSGQALNTKRGGVLAAAAVLMGDRSSKDLTVEQLIQAAGTSRPTFYRWFPGGLQQVMELLLVEANTDLVKRIMAVIQLDIPVEERVAQGIASYFDWAREIGPLAKAIYREAFDPASSARRYREETLAGVQQLLLQEARQMGLKGVTPLMAETLVGWIESAMITLMQHYPVSEEQAAEQARFTSDMLLAMVAVMRRTS